MSDFNHLSQDEVNLTHQLQAIICDEISQSGGSIPFSRYMELALYHKDFGYYNNGLFKFGKSGDFITSPTISSLFGKCLANQINQLFQHTGSKTILEIGSGDGRLMLDILSELGVSIDGYYILDLSASLNQVQSIKLQNELPELVDKVKWINSLPEKFNGIIIANEVLDAQPCDSYIWDNGNLFRQEVSFTNNQFSYVYKLIADDNKIFEVVNQLPEITKHDGFIININLNNRGFIASIADCIDQGCGIFIDYGYGENEYYSQQHSQGTVRGFFRQHKLDDVLITPGLVDITSSIDFSSLALTGINLGLDLIGYTTQGHFLLNCGILDFLPKQNTKVEYFKFTNQINQLTTPNNMGELFKVMGFSKNIDFCDWLGFGGFSQSHLL